MAATVGSAAASSSPLHNVFVYGSLLADDVVNALLKRVPPCAPAVLNGYRRYSVKGRVYPAVLPVESEKVVGRVLRLAQPCGALQGDALHNCGVCQNCFELLFDTEPSSS